MKISAEATPGRPASWPDAERFAARAIPALSGRAEERHHMAIARELLVAASYVAATGAGGRIPAGEVERLVEPELSMDFDDVTSRPLSGSQQTRVVEALTAVRLRGRSGYALEEERNSAAWIALAALRPTRDASATDTTPVSRRRVR